MNNEHYFPCYKLPIITLYYFIMVKNTALLCILSAVIRRLRDGANRRMNTGNIRLIITFPEYPQAT